MTDFSKEMVKLQKMLKLNQQIFGSIMGINDKTYRSRLKGVYDFTIPELKKLYFYLKDNNIVLDKNDYPILNDKFSFIGLNRIGKAQLPNNIEDIVNNAHDTLSTPPQPLHVNNYDIPLLSAVASAGSGIENFDIDIIGSFPVPNIYFKTPPNLKHLKALKVIGDSMTPTLNNDDIVVIEECKEFKNDGVYVINLCGELRVKRLIRRIDGIEVKSDNPTYGSEFIKNDGLKGFLIIGKVRLEIKRC